MSALPVSFDLTSRTALVTGGSSGLGEAMAQALGMAGAKFVLMARRMDLLHQSASKLKAMGISVQTLV
ncbi:MAG: SDR family NAD(P)-dependent oxidoreductase, partial [Burkholderiaceae bacterium]|nr:SDR family NAD(P)-dependent oxidoreductase [Burkholderiaceae bacterium]